MGDIHAAMLRFFDHLKFVSYIGAAGALNMDNVQRSTGHGSSRHHFFETADVAFFVGRQRADMHVAGSVVTRGNAEDFDNFPICGGERCRRDLRRLQRAALQAQVEGFCFISSISVGVAMRWAGHLHWAKMWRDRA